MPVLTCPSCLCVRMEPAERCAALQQLIRPWEAQHVWKRRRRRGSSADGVTKAAQVAWWIRRFRYIDDPLECDRWCSPAETIRRGGGDCDDLAILAASVLLAGRVDASVIVGSYCDGESCDGHAWVEGWDRRGWYLLEATGGRLYRGQPPSGYYPQLVGRPGSCTIAA